MSPGIVSQSTAYGMLSRVALYMAGYPIYESGMYAKAKLYAQKVIDAEYHELNPSFEKFFINLIQDKYDPKESLFEVEFWGNNEGSYTSTAGMVGRNNGIRNTDETLRVLKDQQVYNGNSQISININTVRNIKSEGNSRVNC